MIGVVRSRISAATKVLKGKGEDRPAVAAMEIVRPVLSDSH